MERTRPVLYLDLDDTLISWDGGNPAAAPGARDFLLWALERFEVRWLTTWCPSGEMEDGLLRDLCHMLRLTPDHVRHVRGHDWTRTASKLNGILWLEHLVLGRPFFWLEDEKGVGEREREFLAQHGLLTNYLHVNVTADPYALSAVRALLEQRLQRAERAA